MDWWNTLWPIIAALIPTAGLLFLFLLIMRRIVEADRRERAAERDWQAERDALGGEKPNVRDTPAS